MNQKTKYFIGFFIIIAALIYLFTTSFQSSLQYYVTVEEALEQKELYLDKIIKIAGTAHEIEKAESNQTQAYSFLIKEGDKEIRVHYTGFVPDTFKEEAQVVATGSFDKDGNLEATHILAKCASKYEAKLDTAAP
jgi:cytochrome c-type biogenesis protein CcmE